MMADIVVKVEWHDDPEGLVWHVVSYVTREVPSMMHMVDPEKHDPTKISTFRNVVARVSGIRQALIIKKRLLVIMGKE